MTGGLIEGGVVTGGLVTGGFVTGGLITGGFVTGGFATGGFVTGGLVPGLILGGFAAFRARPAPLTMLLPIERLWPCLVLNPFILVILNGCNETPRWSCIVLQKSFVTEAPH
jgi:hypothetical protein